MVNKRAFVEENLAKLYSAYRPDIPSEIAEMSVSYLKERYEGSLDTAVDVGCGSGQSAIILAPLFNHVYGFDTSEAQIAEAKNSRAHTNLEYLLGDAESLPLSTNSVQLVTAGASLHWFNIEAFMEEVRRILVPDGVFVAYTYHKVCPVTKCPQMAKEVDKLYKEVYEKIHPYCSDEALLSLRQYRNINFPFEEVKRGADIRQILYGTLSEVVGFIESFSAYQEFKKHNGKRAEEFLKYFYTKSKEIMRVTNEESNLPMELYRDIYVTMSRKRIQ